MTLCFAVWWLVPFMNLEGEYLWADPSQTNIWSEEALLIKDGEIYLFGQDRPGVTYTKDFIRRKILADCSSVIDPIYGDDFLYPVNVGWNRITFLHPQGVMMEFRKSP